MKRKDNLLETRPHPPEIGEALERMSLEDRKNWVTMACIFNGLHDRCSGKIHDDSDMPAGDCKCPCHITLPRESSE